MVSLRYFSKPSFLLVKRKNLSSSVYWNRNLQEVAVQLYTPMKCNKNLNLGKEILWASFLPASTLIHTLKSIITQKDEIQNIGIIDQNLHCIRASFQKKLHIKASPLWYVVAELGPHLGMYANTAEPTARNVVLGIKISKLQRCSNGKKYLHQITAAKHEHFLPIKAWLYHGSI